MLGFVAVLVLVLVIGGCKGSTEVTAAATESLGKELASCKDALATKERETDDLKIRIRVLDAEVIRFKETPEQKAASLAERFEALASVEAAAALAGNCQAFLNAYGGHPAARTVKALMPKVAKRQEQLRAEKAQADAMAAIEDIRRLTADVSDGDTLDLLTILAVANHLDRKGLGFDAISSLPKAAYKEATKDPGAERGKAFVITGKVMQITKDGDYFKGLLGTGGYFGNDRVYYFVTNGSTRGVYEDQGATFAGVFTHLWEYPTRMGGSNQAVVVVGHFKPKG